MNVSDIYVTILFFYRVPTFCGLVQLQNSQKLEGRSKRVKNKSASRSPDESFEAIWIHFKTIKTRS